MEMELTCIFTGKKRECAVVCGTKTAFTPYTLECLTSDLVQKRAKHKHLTY